MLSLIRPDSTELWAVARQLVEEYAASLNLDLSFQDFAQEVESLADEYGPPTGCFLLAVDGTSFIGCGAVRRVSDSDCEMKRLYVVPTSRGGRIGLHLQGSSMSVFSNPASRSIEQAKAYTAAILDLLGARNPMEVLQETPLALRKALAGLSEGQMAEPEARGKWSVRHVVQHVADSELVWGYRLRKVLGEDRPPLTGYDQDLWAQRLRYDEANVEHALDDFGVLRRSNLRLLTSASGDDLKRIGVHAERGEESVGHMIGLYAGHDLLHLRQLDRIRRAVVQ